MRTASAWLFIVLGMLMLVYTTLLSIGFIRP